jgi:hypothetical protein
MLSNAYTLAFTAELALTELVTAMIPNPLLGIPNVGLLLVSPIAPNQSSLACEVVAVVPVLTEVVFPPLLVAVTSNGLVTLIPLYSTTTAACRQVKPLVVLKVTVLPALKTLVAHQISVVVPPGFGEYADRTQVAPDWVILVKHGLATEARMLMAATSVFPFAGVGMVTAQELLAPDPVLALVAFTRIIGCSPIDVSTPNQRTEIT